MDHSGSGDGPESAGGGGGAGGEGGAGGGGGGSVQQKRRNKQELFARLWSFAQAGQSTELNESLGNYPTHAARGLSRIGNSASLPDIAASNNHRSVLEVLSQHGIPLNVSVNHNTGNGGKVLLTPVETAAASGSCEALAFLLQKCTVPDEVLNQCLCAAACANRDPRNTVELLLASKADPDCRAVVNGLAVLCASRAGARMPTSGLPPVALALASRNVDAAYALLDAKAQVERRSEEEGLLLSLAAAAGVTSADIRRLLDLKAHVDGGAYSALAVACSQRHFPGLAGLVNLLVSAKANPDHNITTPTPLAAAAWHRHAEAVRALLSAKANPNLRCTIGSLPYDSFGHCDAGTPLVAALTFNHCAPGRMSIVAALLSAGAVAAAPDKLLLLAASWPHGAGDAVQLLRRYNFALPPHPHKPCVLDQAAKNGNVEAVRLLLSIKAMPHGGTLRAAVERRAHTYPDPIAKDATPDIVRLLLQAKATLMQNTLLQAVFVGCGGSKKPRGPEVVTTLLAAKAAVNGSSSSGAPGWHFYIGKEPRTPLALAAGCGDDGVVDALIKAKADIDGTDTGTEYFCPLYEAATHFHTSTCKVLLDAKANPCGNTSQRLLSRDAHGCKKLLAWLREAKEEAKKCATSTDCKKRSAPSASGGAAGGAAGGDAEGGAAKKR